MSLILHSPSIISFCCESDPSPDSTLSLVNKEVSLTRLFWTFLYALISTKLNTSFSVYPFNSFPTCHIFDKIERGDMAEQIRIGSNLHIILSDPIRLDSQPLKTDINC